VIACVLLAAGRGERFGGGKLMALLPTGKTVLETTLDHIAAVGAPIVLVIREDAALRALTTALAAKHQTRATHASSLSVVMNTEADTGMASSIVCGVRAEPDASGWLIALGDMPYVESPTYASVAAGIVSSESIVVPTYRGERGQPVGFGRAYREQLLGISGDMGARAIITRHADRVQRIAVDDAGILQDIDLPSDIAR
jgi:molybdenum cofactor cytidylyltransferase